MMNNHRHRSLFSWLFVAALFVFIAVLGLLQYKWIGEVSAAARERLRGTLQNNLIRFSREFDVEIVYGCRALVPNGAPDAATVEADLIARYQQWKKEGGHSGMFRRLALALPHDRVTALRIFDTDQQAFAAAAWPAEWKALESRIESRLSPESYRNRDAPPPLEVNDGLVFEVPIFAAEGRPFGRREIAWVVFELNLPYFRSVLLPDLLQRHFGSGENQDYEIEIRMRTPPQSIIYQSHPDVSRSIADQADASIGLFEAPFYQVIRFGVRPGMRGPGPPWRGGPPALRLPPPEAASPERGRWLMYVRHRAGSLEAAVSRVRRRNLAVTGGVFLLMLATVAALIHYTRQAQKLAALQMDFVAGVSHELRTPLTAIHTAAYNLRGKMAGNPAQVERYGALIQQESGRLKELVEQILQFAGASAGRVIQEPEPLSIGGIIEDSVESSQGVMQAAGCTVEKSIAADLPLVLGDPVALKHVLQNLLSNAAKYGARDGKWIGVFAERIADGKQTGVEIRVADRGPGIPFEEQALIFDPFFRGRRAVQDQLHGTGLGLNLARKIVEAHGGTIAVDSEPMQGATFIVRIPAFEGEKV